MAESKVKYKIAVVGSGGVGKSALTVQFVQNVFLAQYDPTIEDCYRKNTMVDGTPAYMEILDTAGQEDYYTLRDEFMRNAEGFLFVFSLVERKSFVESQKAYEHLLRVKDSKDVPLVLAGNKADLKDERVIAQEEAKSQAKQMNAEYIETSARLRHNVDEAFCSVVRQMRKYRGEEPGEETEKKKFCMML